MLVEIQAQSVRLTGCQGLHVDDAMHHVINSPLNLRIDIMNINELAALRILLGWTSC